ncbi:hypothetical protein [Phytohalomonas tamaricis]|uniref:hypothetical protein n=1 Tax=Phytohalomonas tamaricis TaxID=2081032 RepID=UPI000D0BCB38|nr:hypothetical protein [Phytohalomonas tamaricis]
MLGTEYLSPNHPLRSDPSKPWPYAVVVGYRLKARRIVKRRTVFVRATGLATAEIEAVMYCRDQAVPVYDDEGRKLYPSRAMSARPLDKSDCFNSDAS